MISDTRYRLAFYIREGSLPREDKEGSYLVLYDEHVNSSADDFLEEGYEVWGIFKTDGEPDLPLATILRPDKKPYPVQTRKP